MNRARSAGIVYPRPGRESRTVLFAVLAGAILYPQIGNAQDTWVQQSPATSPSARAGASMVYDALHQQTVLFGGINLSLLGDTWTWDGTNWALAATTGPSARSTFAFAYDELHQQAVLFGGRVSSTGPGVGQFSETWTWDGTSWTQKAPPNSPPARSFGAMAYDAARQRIVLFGGESNSGTCFSDTWEWDGSNWTQMTPSTVPTGNCYNAMAYDAAHQQVVLVIGENYTADQTWTWDGTNWTQQTPATGLPRLTQLMQIAYDSVRQQTVTFGGYNSTYSSQTWLWDGNTWAQLMPLNSPPARGYPGIAYDSIRQQVVVFGGASQTVSGVLGDTWTLASGTAQTAVTITVPAGVQFTFNGVNYTGTQTINIAQGSYTLSTASPQSTGPGTQAVWVSWSDSGAQSHQVTVGSSAVSITGAYTIQYYLSTAASPSAGGFVSPASGYYNSGASVPVSATANTGYVFANWSGACSGSGACSVTMNSPSAVTGNFAATGALVTINVPAGIQFSLNGITYTGSTTVPLPGGSYLLSTSSPQATGPLSQMVFVSWSDGGAQSHPLLVAGSMTVTGVFKTQYYLSALASPAADGTVSPLAPGPYYDAGTLVLVQAQPNAGFGFDFWGGDCSGSSLVCVVTMSTPHQVVGYFGVQQNWVHLYPAKHPQPRVDHSMAYDATHQQVVLFGGQDAITFGAGVFGDTWLWNGTTWTRQNPLSSPSPRYGAAMGYDAATGQVVLFGGEPATDNSTSGLADTWVWDAHDKTWIPQNVQGPPARIGGVMAYDPSSKQLILFGGYTFTQRFADTWAWNGTTWKELFPAHVPMGRAQHGMATNVARQRIVMYAGVGVVNNVLERLSDTWEWDGADWIQMFPVSKPPVVEPLMAYDPATEEVLLYGIDDTGANNTWAWDGRSWFQKMPVTNPAARFRSAIALDGERQQILLFGGADAFTSRIYDDTWAWLSPAVNLVPQMPTVTVNGGNYVVTMNLANQGNVPDTAVILSSATLGPATSNSFGFIGGIEPGASGSFSAKFKTSQVPGLFATVTFQGAYNANGLVGIPWSASFLVLLP